MGINSCPLTHLICIFIVYDRKELHFSDWTDEETYIKEQTQSSGLLKS